MYEKAWKSILEARYIVIASHMYPDGDTLGSSFALYYTLKKMGKKVKLYNATCNDLPKEFSFLKDFSKVNSKLPLEFDLLITCDSSSLNKIGLQKGNFQILNIDHHKSNNGFGDINVIEEDFSSTGLVVYQLLEKNGVTITKDCAIALYSSIADDTGFFRYGNIDKNCFDVAGKLVSYGVNPKEVSNAINSQVSLAKIRLRAYMLNNFILHNDAQIASIVITKEVLKATGAKRSDTKNIISELRDLATVKVAIMLLEQDDFIKVSLRSDGEIDVSLIAMDFNGGGHKSAAGFDVTDVKATELLKELINRLEGR